MSEDKELRDLLKDLNGGIIQLPDFQREWVWDDNRIKSLIISLANGYPVGAIMFLATGGEINFSYKLFTGVENKNVKPTSLTLDGQQRLTSILNAMFLKKPVETKTEQRKKIKKYYYFNLSEISKEHIDWENAVISVNENKQITSNFGKNIDLDLSTTEKECCEKYIPANIVFNDVEYSEWRNAYYTYHQKKDSTNIMKYVTDIQCFDQKVRNKIINYHIPVITLSKDTPKEAVCQVFENVNTGGVPLNVFELVTALFAADGFELGKDWKKRKEKFEESKILSSLTATDFLTAMTLFTKYIAYSKDNNNAVLCKKKNVLELQLKDYKENADILEDAFIESAKFLNELCIYSSRDLPDSTQLIPLSATIAVLGSKFHFQNIREQIEQWFWCGIFGELYGGANETRYAQDIVGLMDWINGSGKLPSTIERAYFDPCRLLSLQTRGSAAYKGIMALLMKRAKDFISGSDMNLTYFIDKAVDIHHIFPKDYCLKERLGLQDDKWNSIINKTPLSAKTNRMIGGKAPSEYLSKIERENMTESSVLDENLRTHFISIEDIRTNNFDQYFIKRTKSILQLIENAMGKKISGLDSENVIQRYGVSLI